MKQFRVVALAFPLAICCAAVAGAQTNPVLPDALAQLKEHLQLTDSQLQAILTNNEDYNRFATERQARVRQVQAELVDETARNPLDAAALGVRYAEIEAICRQMRDRALEVRGRNTELLDESQRARLRTIEEAIRLAGVVAEAQSGNLAGAVSVAPTAFTSTSLRIGGQQWIGAGVGPANGCYLPFAQLVALTRSAGATAPEPKK